MLAWASSRASPSSEIIRPMATGFTAPRATRQS